MYQKQEDQYKLSLEAWKRKVNPRYKQKEEEKRKTEDEEIKKREKKMEEEEEDETTVKIKYPNKTVWQPKKQ